MLVWAGLLFAVACKREAPPAPPAEKTPVAPPLPPSAAPESTPRCLAADPNRGVFLGATAPAPSAEEEDDLPFSPEVGPAVPFAGGFALGILSPAPKVTTALVYVIGSDGEARRVELGAVHGDVLPPFVAAGPTGLVVAVPDGAPSGMLLRLARLDPAAQSVAWGAEISTGHDESDAFALEVSGKAGMVAWDDWDDHAGGHSLIRASLFPASDPKKASPPVVLSSDEDAESPLVVRREGGFWVSWIGNGRRKGERKDPDHETEPVDLGPRWVTLLPVDDSGKPAAAPVVVTPRDGHVLAFDVAEVGQGRAMVVWRDDATSPATAGGTVRLALVRADGSIEPRAVPVDEVGAARPVFLPDPGGAEPKLWLALGTDAEATRLVGLDAEGRSVAEPSLEQNLGFGAPLAMNAGRLLAVRPRGGGVSLELHTCDAKISAPPGTLPK